MAVRIGLAFNLKPEAPASPCRGGLASSPSPDASRLLGARPPRAISSSPTSTPSGTSRPPSTPSQRRSHRGRGDPPRGRSRASPRGSAPSRPDFVFNIAEGLYGPNREGHVPAICEFLGIPYHASDPLTLSLCLAQGPRPRRSSRITACRPRRSSWPAPGTTPGTWTLPFPLFAKPCFEGSGKGVSVQERLPQPGGAGARRSTS